MATVRYNSNGSLDTSFGSGGIIATDFFSLFDESRAVAVQSDGNIVVAGAAVSAATSADFALVQFIGDPPFDSCLQDDSSGNILEYNSITGDYFFNSNNGFSVGGTGNILVKGCLVTLQHVASGSRLVAKVNNCQKRGHASIQIFPSGVTFTIMDRNTADNDCTNQ